MIDERRGWMGEDDTPATGKWREKYIKNDGQ
jgi:hypothetical protein